MSVAYHQAQKVKYRVTLELEVFSDMNPHQIQWDKVLQLEPSESVDAYVEDLSVPDRWWPLEGPVRPLYQVSGVSTLRTW